MKPTTITSLLVAAIAASQLGATDCGQIITDRGFDLWCGDQLCYWKLERGEVAQVPTWTSGDDGVELQGTDVAIAQMTAVTSTDGDCIQFDMVADIDESAVVTLEADVFGDGTVDWTERLPTSSWEKLSLRIGFRGSYEGIKFRLTKQGTGHAVLARIGAQIANDCPTYTDVLSRPEGAKCYLDTDCGSGVCNQQVCSTCRGDGDCTGGDVCGAFQHAPGGLDTWWSCVAPASHQLGERCHEDAECTTGVCNGLYCSECNQSTACAGGEVCTTPTDTLWLDQCGPGGNDRVAGAACVTDDDCVSAHCDGTPLGLCDDGVLPCFDSFECPPHADSTPPTCTFVAVAGGTCQ